MHDDDSQLLHDVATVLWGPSNSQRDNGLRSEFKQFKIDTENAIKEIKDDVHEKWYEKRPVECLGLEALNKYKEECMKQQKKSIEEEVAVKVAKINLKGNSTMQVLQLIASLAIALLVFFK